jgi:hypothetical protein
MDLLKLALSRRRLMPGPMLIERTGLNQEKLRAINRQMLTHSLSEKLNRPA